MGEYICPKCGDVGIKAPMYRRCVDCHKRIRNESYAARWAPKQKARREERLADPSQRARKQEISRKSQRRSASRKRPLGPNDKIYFVQEAGGGHIKIGFTRQSIELRLLTLQIGNPHELIVLAVINGASWQESELHERFEAYWVRGEWFHPAPALLDYIAALTSESLAA